MVQIGLFTEETIPAQLRKKVNRNFVIRYKDKSKSNKTKLIGAGMLHKLVGTEWAIKLCNEALNSKEYIYTRKLRRGLTIKFHTK